MKTILKNLLAAFVFNALMAGLLFAESHNLPPVKPFKAADFSLKGEDGKQYSLSQFRGKLVVINFWATWCPPCREEMPSMERAWQKLKNSNIVFLAINVGETEDEIFPFLASYPVSFPLPMDINGELVKQYPVVGLPTTYIVSAKGMVTHKAVGTRSWDHPELIRQLRKMAAR